MNGVSVMSVKQSNATKIHWNRITPGRLLVLLLVVVLGLFFFENWFPKGWAVLIATASVTAAIMYFMAKFGMASLFQQPFQYSIRSMLIFMAIFSIVGGWMGQRIRDAIIQKRVFGPISYSDERFYGPLPFPLVFLGDMNKWEFFRDMRDATECDFVRSNATDVESDALKRCHNLRILHVEGNPVNTDTSLEHLKDLKQLARLEFIATTITEEDLKQLTMLENLRELTFRNTRVADTGLKYLVGIKQLRSLWIEKESVSNVGLSNIKKLTQLEKLTINEAGITDARLDFLKGMKNLLEIDLTGNRITDSGLQQLKDIAQLEKLVLCDTDITDAGLTHLKEMKQLKYLYLYNTNITDAGLKQLGEFENLRVLGLLGTKVTDAGLKYLVKMTQLQELILHDTNTTFPARDKLQKVLPNCTF
jgi:Leucine-rich repeat (LRR) protein